MKKQCLAWILLGLAGCAEEGPPYSPDVSTLDLDVTLYAEDRGMGADVDVTVSGPLGAMRLSDGDQISLVHGKTPLSLSEAVGEYDKPMYRAEMPLLSDDLFLTIARQKDTSIVDFRIPVPPPIGLTAEPIVGTGPLVIGWTAYEDKEHWLSLDLSGSCIKPLSRNLPNDVGAYKIMQGELIASDPAAPSNCPLKLKLTRNQVTQGRFLPNAPFYQFYASVMTEAVLDVAWML